MKHRRQHPHIYDCIGKAIYICICVCDVHLLSILPVVRAHDHHPLDVVLRLVYVKLVPGQMHASMCVPKLDITQCKQCVCIREWIRLRWCRLSLHHGICERPVFRAGFCWASREGSAPASAPTSSSWPSPKQYG